MDRCSFQWSLRGLTVPRVPSYGHQILPNPDRGCGSTFRSNQVPELSFAAHTDARYSLDGGALGQASTDAHKCKPVCSAAVLRFSGSSMTSAVVKALGEKSNQFSSILATIMLANWGSIGTMSAEEAVLIVRSQSASRRRSSSRLISQISSKISRAR